MSHISRASQGDRQEVLKSVTQYVINNSEGKKYKQIT